MFGLFNFLRKLEDYKMRKKNSRWLNNYLLTLLVSMFILASGALYASAMTRTIKEEPAIVIVAFGTTTEARVTYDFFELQLRQALPARYQNLQIEWAFTSEIIRERANRKFAQAKSTKRYRSVAQVLADLENDGYRKIALQPLHIFPGQEFEDLQNVINAFRKIGLRLENGGTLFHKWDYVFEVLSSLEEEFLSPDEGCNVLVAHGSPETLAGANAAYLGLSRLLEEQYENVFIGSVDGVLTRSQVLKAAKGYPVKRVRFIPLMYVAGDHIMNDIMSLETKDAADLSWAMELKKAGLAEEAVLTSYNGKEYFKGLGFYKNINRIFIDQLTETLDRLEKY